VTDKIVRDWQARLYPTPEQADRLNQWAGSLRFLWNRLLDREKAEYQATRKFIWRKELQSIAVGMKRQAEMAWLSDLPAHAVLDTVARLDGALRRMISERKAGRKCGFPKPKKKFVRESGIYCVGQATGRKV
jgi:putative transposase